MHVEPTLTQYQGQAVQCFTTYSDSIFILVYLKVHMLDSNLVSEYIYISRGKSEHPFDRA